jgi:hypothetical protein
MLPLSFSGFDPNRTKQYPKISKVSLGALAIVEAPKHSHRGVDLVV